jgi:type I restriction enzyme M protein
MLFGRDQVLSDIKQQLGTSGTQSNPVLIEGNRRTGKTSILHELRRSLNTDEIVPVYVSLQAGEGSQDSRPGLDTVEVFRLIAREMGYALKGCGIEVELPGESLTDPDRIFKTQFTRKLNQAFDTTRPFETLSQYVDEVLKKIAPRKILLMLDEFDHIHLGTQSGVTNPQVPDNIRSLVHEHQNLALIISGTKELRKIRDDYWSTLFGFAYPISVASLPTQDAKRLVEEPARGLLDYQPKATEEIVRLAGHQPFLIQTLCSRVFSTAVEDENVSVGLNQVTRAANRMAQDNEHFRNLFDREIKTDQQRLILMLILSNLDGDSRTLNRHDIESMLFADHVPYDEEKLDDDIEFLIELEIIEDIGQDGEGLPSYKPSVPFFGIWVDQNRDQEEISQRVRDEVL